MSERRKQPSSSSSGPPPASVVPPDADRIARTCYARFALLPKTGRPTADEWTVLSAVLAYWAHDDRLEVVSLGTGTKCLSKNLLSGGGDRLNDSHAEVMARRGFVRYLMQAMHSLGGNENDGVSDDCIGAKRAIFRYDTKRRRFVLSDRIRFHFFTTHPPCGDASIFQRVQSATEKAEQSDDGDEPVACKRRRTEANNDEPTTLAEDGAGDIVAGFTGGKLVSSTPDEGGDLMAQHTGALRTKPGRGIRTLSLSCSDKLSRWSVVGIQGAMLHVLLANGGVFMDSITVASACDVDALERAIWRRWSDSDASSSLPEGFTMRAPIVQRSGEMFAHRKRDGLQPAPGSIVWCNVPEKDTEVAVSGKRQGVTKKLLSTPAGRLKICKVELLRLYQRLILVDFPEIGVELGIQSDTTYDQVKRAAAQYTEACDLLKTTYFMGWTTKPSDINAFCTD